MTGECIDIVVEWSINLYAVEPCRADERMFHVSCVCIYGLIRALSVSSRVVHLAKEEGAVSVSLGAENVVTVALKVCLGDSLDPHGTPPRQGFQR